MSIQSVTQFSVGCQYSQEIPFFKTKQQKQTRTLCLKTEV